MNVLAAGGIDEHRPLGCGGHRIRPRHLPDAGCVQARTVSRGVLLGVDQQRAGVTVHHSERTAADHRRHPATGAAVDGIDGERNLRLQRRVDGLIGIRRHPERSL